ncbi:MAG: hypothetical protein U0441_26440 [Polyangiaceae bacterium]
MRTRFLLLLSLSFPALVSSVTLAGCGPESSGSGGGGATTTTTTTSSASGGTTSSSGGTGGSGAQGGTTTSGGGGAGGVTTTSTTSTTDTGGSGPACGAIARQLAGSSAADAVTVAAVAVTSDGGAILAGEFGGAATIGPQTLTSAGGQDAFVVRLSAGGGVAWAKRFGANYDDRVKAVAPLADGGAVIVGTFDGVVDFGGKTLTSIGGPDAFIVRLDASGALVLALQIENADARGVAIAEGGDLLVAGDFSAATKIVGVPVTPDGADDLFVVRLSEQGTFVALRHVAFATKPGVIAIAASAGRTYVAGSFQGTTDFGTGALVSAGAKDAFLVRIDDALATVFARRYGDDSSQEARAVAVLSDGSAALVGSFKSVLDFDGTVLTADTLDDAFVARVDDAGAVVFAKRFGDAQAQIARGVAVTDADEILVAGGFQGTIDPGDGAITAADGEDVFLTRLDASGAAVKTLGWGATLDQRARSVAVDPCGAVVLGGDFNGALTFGADALTAGGSSDGFVARLAP